METWISADNTIGLWAFLLIAATVSIVLEQKYQWAAKLSGAVIALIIGLAATNFGLVPQDTAVYDAVWAYIVPLAIPLLLFHVDIHAIFRESGRLLAMFLLSSIGTVLGVIIAFFALKDYIPELDKVSAMIGATYTGGGVNFAAMVAKYEPTKDIVAATTVADNLVMSVYFIMLILIAGMGLFRKKYPTPHINQFEKEAAEGTNDRTIAEAYWQPKTIGLKDIGISIAASALLVALAFKASSLLKAFFGAPSNILEEIAFGLITDKYLLLTTFTLVALLIFRKQFAKLHGAQELGTYAIYLFFVVIAMPASIALIVQKAPILFVFVIVVMLVNLIWSLGVGKLFKFTLEEIILACNANVGGPTTAAALAISQGWTKLIGPILVVGTVGYIVGNYIGTLLYIFLSKLM
ncbi:DUF819 family protein [Wohlfahrtiimonas populi]|uniref:DUF819 family protein n=1 Tax=Wohlfahrtiimonas populi TaxID=1940240 RepID=UPI00098D10B0|nr:DUF819 family protein [Wohlfahrtiimonas populi]